MSGRDETRPMLTVTGLLAGHSEHVKTTIAALRVLVKDVLPEVEERVYPGWKAIGFRHPEAGFIGGLFPMADHVKVAFESGARLSDPAGALELPKSSGKTVRYVTVTGPDAIDRATLTALLLEAAAQRR